MARVWFAWRLGAPPGQTDRKAAAPSGGRPVLACVRHNAQRALRSRRGVYTVEFALIANAFFLATLGGVDLALQGLTAIATENALLHASRAGSLGCEQPDGTRAGQAGQQTILAAARAAGGGLLVRDRLTLETEVFPSVKVANTGTGGAKGAAGTAGQTVVYTLTYDQPFFLVGGLLGKASQRHTGVIVIKNEPFSKAAANAQTCP